jgi:CRP-like cAMP-binding protein
MSGGDHFNRLRAAIFEDISAETVRGLCSQGRHLSFPTGQTLFNRGQSAEELMILEDGVVELVFPVEIMGARRDLTLESKRSGDVVAWSALIAPYHFTLSARCATECTVTALKRATLQAFFQENPETGYLFMRNLAGVIGRRLQAMQTIWVHDLQASVARR